jgi:hypothetical protein
MIETILLKQKEWRKVKRKWYKQINNKLQILELQMDLRNRSSTELICWQQVLELM